MIKIAPSILSADFTRLGDEVRDVLRGGAEYIHVDVMDGVFVPNITVGVPVVKSLRKAFPDAFLDVHLMITEPKNMIEAFCDAGADIVVPHWEADTEENIVRALDMAAAKGVKTGLALRPVTDARVLEKYIGRLDMILAMTVEPGFAGQSFMPEALPNIRYLRERINAVNPACELEVDGGINAETAALVTEAGANVLVAGSAVFGKNDRADAIKKLRGE